ncbi:MAG: histidine kinase [Usitatibacteraceae bacterium]
MTLPPKVQAAADVLAQYEISANIVAPLWYRLYLRYRPETPPPLWGASEGYWLFRAIKTSLGLGVFLTIGLVVAAKLSAPQEQFLPLTPAAQFAIWAFSGAFGWLVAKELAVRSREEGERIGLTTWEEFSASWRPSLADVRLRISPAHFWLRSVVNQKVVLCGWAIGFIGFLAFSFAFPFKAVSYGEGAALVYLMICAIGALLTAKRIPMPTVATVWYVSNGLFIGVLVAACLWQTIPASLMNVPVSDLTLAFSAIALVIHTHEWLSFEEQKNVALRVERAEQQNQLAEIRLQTLKAQIEPHFIFNNIAHLKSLISTDPMTAQRMVDELSDFLRGSLRSLRADQTTVREEFELARAYLALAKLRMGSRLSTNLQLSDRAAHVRIPPLLLQTLLENAIFHGLEPKAGDVSIKVTAEIIGNGGKDRLQLRVIDDGIGFGAGHSGGSGVGLANIRDRLASTYGGAGEFVLTANTPSGVIAELNLPVVE